MFKIKRYNSLNENYEIGQEVMVKTQKGWTDAVVKNKKLNTIYWSNPQGQMGASNVKDVRDVTVKDLRDRYFISNSKFSKFYVPFEVIKETEKAYFLGYNGKGIWSPKKLVDNIWPKKFDYPNTPRDGYQISMLVYLDEDKQKFFDDYALYIHEQVRKKKKESYQHYKQGNKQLLEEVKSVVKYVYELLKMNREPEVSWINYQDYSFFIDKTWKIQARSGSIKHLTFYVGDQNFDASPENVKNDTLERRMMLAKLSKALNSPIKSQLKKMIVDQLEEVKKSKDSYAEYSDDGRVWRAEQNRAQLEYKLKNFLEKL